MEIEESKGEAEVLAPVTKGGKIINQLEDGEQRDSNVMEQAMDPFAAE